MSYYESNYYRNPGPVYGPAGDWGEPVPGWGVLPNMAGPECVGIGQALAPSAGSPSSVLMQAPQMRAQSVDKGVAWWWWVVGGLAVGAGVGIAHNKGLLRKLPLVGRSFR